MKNKKIVSIIIVMIFVAGGVITNKKISEVISRYNYQKENHTYTSGEKEEDIESNIEVEKEDSSENNTNEDKSQDKVTSHQKSNIEDKILGKYVIYEYDMGIGVAKFTEDKLIDGYVDSQGEVLKIQSKREDKDSIYYKIRYGEVKITLLDDDSIDYNGFAICKLLDTQEFINEIYKRRGKEGTTYESLSYFGITKKDINEFYNK